MITIPCSIIRGGTTKGVFIAEDVLPSDAVERDRLLVALMGSPDPRQIDGLGGADPLTSKVALVSPSQRSGYDVEYESIEIAINEAFANHGLMCGNLAAGVGYFAVAEGLVVPVAPVTTVRIYCRSNGKTIVARMPVEEGQRAEERISLASVSRTVELTFEDPQGAVTGRLLPADEARSNLTLSDGSSVRCSIVDAGTLYGFLAAEDFGLTGAESAAELDGNANLRSRVELTRVAIAELLNSVLEGRIPNLSARRIKVAIVGERRSGENGFDIAARIINPAKVHKAYAVSGAICLGAAAVIPGTLVAQSLSRGVSPASVRIAHPSGVIAVATEFENRQASTYIRSSSVQRTTRTIMRGNVFVPF